MSNSVTVNDPTGSEFDMYGHPTPEGVWAYALDDYGVLYRRSGWPFGDDRWDRNHGEPRPRSVRVSPDVKPYAWRNEYVLLYPGRLGEHDKDGTTESAHAWLNLWIRTQGMGGIIFPHVGIDFDLANQTVRVSDNCPAMLREQAEMKATRLLAFLLDHQSRARHGRRRVIA